ncbi:polysaccharide lyase family 7 protein [Lignipirellula cremea]|uniref:Alginate lyase n=1 Tax=Lignipirellula cremea TaxID=2528010 RepID=A0A518DM24_9BACT|nr:polysaccharide lyase family 7 protein [Lignipirellula cremea]QDU92872.1 Alginate lyase precursor [Lignipirellula cremea]
MLRELVLLLAVWVALPAVVLADPLPATVIDLSSWKLTLPVDTPIKGNPDEISAADLQTFSHPDFFHLGPAGKGVVFRAPCGGATTKGSKYPRCELREWNRTGESLASWSTTDPVKRELALRLAITSTPAVKQHVVCAQIHDKKNDLLMIRLEGEKLLIERTGESDVMIDNHYQTGTPFDLRISVRNGVVEVAYNGQQKLQWKVDRSGCYFKAGCYTQSNPSRGDAADASGEVVIYALRYVQP